VARVIVMIVVVIMIFMIFMIFVVVVVFVVFVVFVVVMIINMDLAVKVLRFSPNERRSNGSLNGQTATGTQTPLKNSTE
jgi:hypothetical protein